MNADVYALAEALLYALYDGVPPLTGMPATVLRARLGPVASTANWDAALDVAADREWIEFAGGDRAFVTLTIVGCEYAGNRDRDA